jgi:hypothetical protein
LGSLCHSTVTNRLTRPPRFVTDRWQYRPTGADRRDLAGPRRDSADVRHEPCGARARRARRELARLEHEPVAPAVPAPVELGRRLHRHGSGGVEPGTRRGGAPLAVLRSVAQRAAPPHRVRRASAVLPRPGLLADRAQSGCGRDSADLGDRPASDPRHGRARDLQTRARPRQLARAARGAAAEARRMARLPLSRTDSRRLAARRDLASVGVRDGQLPAVGRGARPDRARATPGARVREGRRCGRRRRRTADRRGVRPVRVPRRAVPRARIRPGRDPRGDAVRAAARALQRPSRAGRSRPRRDLADRRLEGVSVSRAGIGDRACAGRTVGRGARKLRRLRRAGRPVRTRSERGRARAALRGRARQGARGADGGTAGRFEGRGGRGLRGDEPSSERSGL